MSQHSYTCIEQLDLATEQLRQNNPSYARFALILTDNVVELMIHRLCSSLVSSDNMWLSLREPKYSPKQRENALGQRFDKKVRFLASIQKITVDQADFICICHKYRNELYHAGLKHDDIIWDIAWYYHELAILLFETINPSNSYDSGANVSDTVARHAGERGMAVMGHVDSIANSLRSEHPSKARSLASALSISAVDDVDLLLEGLRFLIEDDPQQRTEDEIIYGLQFFDYIHSTDPVAKTVWDKVKTVRQRDAAIVFLKETWEPKYKINPLPAFMEQAKKIETQRTDVLALKAFEKFKQDVSYFGRIIDEAANALDSHIQFEIDLARGK